MKPRLRAGPSLRTTYSESLEPKAKVALSSRLVLSKNL
jgi:hypothetical protein